LGGTAALGCAKCDPGKTIRESEELSRTDAARGSQDRQECSRRLAFTKYHVLSTMY